MKPLSQGTLQKPLLAAGKGWVAVDKPAGMTVHNAPGKDLCSVIQQNAGHWQINIDKDFGINPVHRLDKETSGVVLLATTMETFRYFSKQFESRKVQKHYIAVLHGRLEIPEKDTRWTAWRWPLSGTSTGRRKPQGTGRLYPCETRYRIIGYSSHYTLAEIELRTGRTHQIRRHAVMAGHPVAGDLRYGPARAANYLKQHFKFNRLALHAHAVSLHLPGENAWVTIKTLEIPEQIADLLKKDGMTDHIDFTGKNE